MYTLTSADDGILELYSTPEKAFKAIDAPNKSPCDNPVNRNGKPLKGWDGKDDLDIYVEGYDDKWYTLSPIEVDPY